MDVFETAKSSICRDYHEAVAAEQDRCEDMFRTRMRIAATLVSHIEVADEKCELVFIVVDQSGRLV